MAYQIVKILGEGGMGKVYQATDPALNRTVAIKAFHDNIIPNAKAVKRFMRESQISASLDHPNIVKVYQFVVENNRPLLIMEYVEGMPFFQYIENQKLNLEQSLEIFEKIVEAVHYAHRKQIIHRDIKPSNIMVRTNGEPILMDFGIAKAAQIEDLTRTGEIMGTVQYMAPEQASGLRHEMDHRVDIYSLGAVLYEILTEKTAISSTTLTEMLFEIGAKEIILPRQHNSNISEDIEQICMKALCKNKEHRYETAKAFAEDIRNYRQGKKIKASGFIQKQQWRKRFSILGIIFTILLVGIGILWSYQNLNNSQAAPQTSTAKKIEEALNNSQKFYEQKEFAQGYFYLEDFANAISNDKNHYDTEREKLEPHLKKFLTETYTLVQIYTLANSNEQLEYQAKLEDIGKKFGLEEYIKNNFWIGSEENLKQKLTNFATKFAETKQWPKICFYEAKNDYGFMRYTLATQKFQDLESYYSTYQGEYPLQKILWEYSKLLLTYNLGLCYFQQKKFSEAEEKFSKIEKEWNNNIFLVFIQKQKEILQKEKKIEQNLSMDRFYANTLVYLGTSKLANNLYSEDFTKNTTTGESQQKLVESIESILNTLQQEKYINAISQYSEEWALLQEMKARMSIWKAPQTIEKINNAISIINGCLEKNPMRFSCYLIRGSAYLELKQYERALDDFEYAHQLNPVQIESTSKLLLILPYYQAPKYDDIENIIGVLSRWWLRMNMNVVDIWEEDISKIRSYYRTKWQEQETIATSAKDAEKFYQYLFASESLANLAQNSFLAMQPYSDTLNFLDNKKKELEESLNNTKDEQSNKKIQKQINTILRLKEDIEQKKLEKTNSQTLYLLSSITYQKRPSNEILEVFSQVERLRVLHNLIFSLECKTREECIKFYLAARILAQLQIPIPQEINHKKPTKKYYRMLLVDLIQNELKYQETKKIIILRVLQEIGYFDVGNQDFICKFVQKKNDVFIEILSLPLLTACLNSNKNIFLFFQQSDPLTQLYIVHSRPSFVNDYISVENRKEFWDIAAQTWKKSFTSSDDRQKMLAILTTKHEEIRKRYSQEILEHLDSFFFNKNYILQKSVIALCTETPDVRNIALENVKNNLHKLLEDTGENLEIKMMATICLLQMADEKLLKKLETTKTSLFEKIAFLYVLPRMESKNFANLVMMSKSLCENALHEENSEGKGLILGIFSHFFYTIVSRIPNAMQANAFKMFIETSIITCLNSNDIDLIFWGLMSTTKIDNLSKKVWGIILEKLSLKNDMYYGYLGALINIAARDPKNTELNDIRIKYQNIVDDLIKNPQNHQQELLKFSWFYKQLLRNNKIEMPINYEMLNKDSDIALEKNVRNILESTIFNPAMLKQAEEALQTIIKIGNTVKSIENNSYERYYFLRYLKNSACIQQFKGNYQEALNILEKTIYKEQELYMIDAEIAHYWLRIKLSSPELANYPDIENEPSIRKFWGENWQNKEIQNCRHESLYLCMKALLQRKKKNFESALDTLYEAYILCPEDPQIPSDMMEIFLKERKDVVNHRDLNNANNLIYTIFQHISYKEDLRWYHAKIYCLQKNYQEAFKIFAERILDRDNSYKITPNDIEFLQFPKESLIGLYFLIAHKNLERRNYYNAGYWLEKAFQEGLIIEENNPSFYQESKNIEKNKSKIIEQYPKFKKIWTEMYKSKKK